MFVEIHAIQNFAPSNLNRDDTGSPKDCEFGGFRRARVSSQCWKRAIREHFQSEELLPKEQLATRTKRLSGELARRLLTLQKGATPEQCQSVAASAVQTLGFGLDAKSGDAGKTSVLLFLGEDQIEQLANQCVQHWTALAPASDGKKPPAPRSKKESVDLLKDVSKALNATLSTSKAVDLALFGRMIAEAPGQNVNAACQVAHAISTHRVAPEFDYYTAVDDLGKDDETGAGMLGTIEFNSACFYRYANVDFTGLRENLQNDRELALAGLKAFLQSFVGAVPKAKQNGFAAQNLPSLVMIVIRDRGLWSLANAFAKPADSRGDGLVTNSSKKLTEHWEALTKMYGDDGIRKMVLATTEAEIDKPAGFILAEGVQDLIMQVMSEVQKEN